MTGNTARLVSRRRPRRRIVAASPSESVRNRLLLHWGVVPVQVQKEDDSESMIQGAIAAALSGGSSGAALEDYVAEFRRRMDRHCGIIRPVRDARRAAEDALAQARGFGRVSIASRSEIPALLRARHLALASAAYLEACAAYAEEGGGSRGSAVVSGPEGEGLHPALDPEWNALPEKLDLLDLLEETRWNGSSFETRWEKRRPIPESDDWFETVWRAYRDGDLFKPRR